MRQMRRYDASGRCARHDLMGRIDGLGFSFSFFCQVRERAGEKSVKTVSYTHLDVYKRQGLPGTD